MNYKLTRAWHWCCPQLPEASGGVRSVTPQRPGLNDANIYVGTIKNMILEGSLQRRFNQVL